MSKLLRRSKQRFRSAKRDYEDIASDDCCIDGACFQLQQAMEFALKYWFEINGHKYPYGHDINALIVACHRYGITCDAIDALKPKASLYTSWETKTSYFDDFSVLLSDLEECFELVDSLIKYIEKFSEDSTSAPTKEVLQWCRENAPTAIQGMCDSDLLAMMLPIYDEVHNKGGEKL